MLAIGTGADPGFGNGGGKISTSEASINQLGVGGGAM